jgi:uncharacterized membrane protein
VALGAGAALVAASLVTRRRTRQRERALRHTDSAPERARRAPSGSATLTANAVTINRPRDELFAFWRAFENLPAFMENVLAARPLGQDRWEWRIGAPAGRSVRLETVVTDERPGERIAWRSLPGSDVEAEGDVTFRDAPAGRGAVVEATVAYHPPADELGRLIATLFQREPQIQGRRELRRFKMLMETGEIATSANRRPEAQEG